MSTGERTGMDRLLPHWHFREVHSLAVPADQETVMSAVYEAVWSEAPLARVLMAVTGADVSAERRIVTDSLSAMGDVIPSGDDEFLFAGIQALDDIPRPTGTTAELVERCTDPGIVKVGMNVRFAGECSVRRPGCWPRTNGPVAGSAPTGCSSGSGAG